MIQVIPEEFIRYSTEAGYYPISLSVKHIVESSMLNVQDADAAGRRERFMSKSSKKRRPFLLLLLVLLLTACKSAAETTEKQTEVGNSTESGSESSDSFRVLVGYIDGKTIEKHRCTLIFENLDDRTVTFDNDGYVIEAWKDNRWISVQTLREFRTSGCIETIVEPGKKTEEDINWISEYGELSHGKYRILIPVGYEETTEEAGKIVAEFQIKDKNDAAVEGLPIGDMYDPKVYSWEIPEYGICMEVVEPDNDGCNLKYSYTENNPTDLSSFKVGEDYCLQNWDPEKKQWSTIHTTFSDGVTDTSSDVPNTIQIRWRDFMSEPAGVFRIITPVVADRYLGEYKVFYLSRTFMIE